MDTFISKIFNSALSIVLLILIHITAIGTFNNIFAGEPNSDSNLILIPGGWFEMGNSNGEKDEKPEHSVYVDSFYMGKTELTVWEYLECVKQGGCDLPLWWNRDFFGMSYRELSGQEWLMMPVTGVSWDDAVKYCRWRGEHYRLPTEAEWEYAARAGSEDEYPWGNNADSAEEYAVADEKINPVMSRKPNNFGIYDMIGNVWEWCNDRYGKTYYSVSEKENPMGPEESKKQRYRVVRGGAWNEYIWNMRTSNRNYGEQHRRFGGVGFRICKSKAEK
jgi:formylglycine-generating enzyme required for sulfatase activity